MLEKMGGEDGSPAWEAVPAVSWESDMSLQPREAEQARAWTPKKKWANVSKCEGEGKKTQHLGQTELH